MLDSLYQVTHGHPAYVEESRFMDATERERVALCQELDRIVEDAKTAVVGPNLAMHSFTINQAVRRLSENFRQALDPATDNWAEKEIFNQLPTSIQIREAIDADCDKAQREAARKGVLACYESIRNACRRRMTAVAKRAGATK